MFEGDVVLGNSLTGFQKKGQERGFEGDVVLGNSLTVLFSESVVMAFEGDVVLGNSLTQREIHREEKHV